MSKKELRNAKTGPEKFVRFARYAFIAFSVVVLFALMIMLALAVGLEGLPRIVYACVGAVLALLFFVVYGIYAFNVSMGTVLSAETTDKVVYLTTKRKVFTYDVKRGCTAVRRGRNRFVCTFETQSSRDKFVFYTHAPFSSFSDSQFSEEDIRRFCPDFDEMLEDL